MIPKTTELPGYPTWSRRRRIGHYGGALDKEDSTTEGSQPYAATHLLELRAMRGEAYTRDADSFVADENLAIARFYAGLTRENEKLYTNSVPGTSDEKLENWVITLAIIVQPDDTRHDIRQRAAAHYEAPKGNDPASVDEAIETLLGRAFVRCWRQKGTDLANPPTQTFWPGVNPGPAAYDLGGGAWLSERAHLVIEVEQPDDMTSTEFLELLNVHLFRMLTIMLPIGSTFDWVLAPVEDGFELDISDMDFHGLVP